MISNFHRSVEILVLAIALTGLISNIAAKDANAQTIEPNSEKQINSKPKGYFGVGGAIGLGGNSTALSTGGLSLFTKTVFSENLALHSSTVIFGSNIAVSTSALTFNLPIRNEVEQIIFTPFFGGGVMFSNEGGLKTSPHITGGLDVPLSPRLTGTIRMNLGFMSDRPTESGLVLGVGYSF
ncbi:MAG: hypothetical protein SFT94_07170 [Pseudanabaenaceae cyanobacterium bins.68]|nr:hypothetical protein [Pseudanabaenaceae cyanobacterium bins.68]